MTNDEKLIRIKKRKILKLFIIIFALLTIILSCVSLFMNVTPVYAIVCFVIEAGLTKYRDSLIFKEEDKNYNKKKK